MFQLDIISISLEIMPRCIKECVGLPSSNERRPSLNSVVLFQGTIEIAFNFVEHRISLTFTITKISL